LESGPLNKCPGLWPNRKLPKHFKCLGGLPAVSPSSSGTVSLPLSPYLPLCLFVAQPRIMEVWARGRGRKWGHNATLNNISSAKVFLWFVPTQCAQKKKKGRKGEPNEKKTLRAKCE